MSIQRRRVQVKAAKSYKKWNNWTEGDYVIGTYEGSTIDNYGKQNYGIKLLEVNMADPTTDNGDALEEGMVLGLNHCGSLGYRMDSVPVGTEIEVVYRGTASLPDKHKFKGKDCHQVEVSTFADEETSVDL